MRAHTLKGLVKVEEKMRENQRAQETRNPNPKGFRNQLFVKKLSNKLLKFLVINCWNLLKKCINKVLKFTPEMKQ